ncbi:MAG: ArsR family transcriptional regulator [Candidatus Lokiarchaeota archaeon]|nr:ArsR family transcriptional regulator [Candidatus Lokiarchaeota archaeon]
MIPIEKEIRNKIDTIIRLKKKTKMQQIIKEIYNDEEIIKNINKNEIERLFKQMIKENIFTVAPILRNHEIIDLSLRLKILKYLEKNPGKSIEELTNYFKIKKSKIIWHLTILKKYQYLKKLDVNNKILYYICKKE